LFAYLQPDDVVLDIGGGAGRYLPLALHCRELVNIEPSPGMGERFQASARQGGIGNARWLPGAWLDTEVEGDVVFVAHVLNYVEDILPFVEKLQRAARRQVMLLMHSLPPTNHGAERFRLVHNREPAPAPGFRELLPVLWDMGLLPEVRVLGPSDFIVGRERHADREAAVASVLQSARLEPAERESARQRLLADFERLFEATTQGYAYRPAGASQLMLITWTTGTDGLPP
jgi:cyclopropane fatty-acyl-phospholipid synthase-like methyltransferase